MVDGFAAIQLFPRDSVVGVFRGFQQGGLEFHADLVLPYRNEFQSRPMHGQFLLVQLETPDEAVLGRITSLSSDGRLAIGSGEEFNIRAVLDDRPVPEELREQYLKYRVMMRVLGVLRKKRDKLTFVPSHRRLPHLGSKVAFPSAPVLREIAGHNIQGAAIGHLAFGEYIYAEGDQDFRTEDWMQIASPSVKVHFPVESLVSRRSFVFARAGFGKSNLNKLLFSKLYENTPSVIKRGGKEVPVGTVIFDPDGEYFWPDDRARPGLCDVPHLEEKLVVFTDRKSSSPFYQSFVAGGSRLDIRRLSANDVIGIALSPDRQEQQNVRKLRGLRRDKWEELVDLVDTHRNQAPIESIRQILDLEPSQDMEAFAARANMTAIVTTIHDKSSRLMERLLDAISQGKICVIDVSRMRGGQSLIMSGLILRKIFSHNQEEFTKAESNTYPTIAVVEEAQSVLNQHAAASEPYVDWVKEGRKYDLGALLITQQPGSIPGDILSQGDNWFVFHLLSVNDLITLKRANSHFSDDLLSSILNEPIPGQGVFWSSVEGKPYPISIRAFSFEEMYPMRDKDYNSPAGSTYAAAIANQGAGNDASQSVPPTVASDNGEVIDHKANIEQEAINHLKNDTRMMRYLNEGIAFWSSLMGSIEAVLPKDYDRSATTNVLMKALDQICGEGQWETFNDGVGLRVRKIS